MRYARHDFRKELIEGPEIGERILVYVIVTIGPSSVMAIRRREGWDAHLDGWFVTKSGGESVPVN